VEGQVRYIGGNILYDGRFYPQILELLIENIEKNDPLVVVAYPDTGNKPNMATYERVQTLKNEVSKYSDMVTEISYLPQDIEDNLENNTNNNADN
jgi:hypothetical protein